MKNFEKARIAPLIGIIVLAAVIVFSTAACNRGGSSASAPASGSTESAAAPAQASAASSTSADSSTASVSNSIDAFIVEYEKFIDDYIAAFQKMMAGDLTVASEFERLGELAESWGERWEDYSESDLSPAQAARLNELTEKFSSSMGF